jgi:hypothetical protein
MLNNYLRNISQNIVIWKPKIPHKAPCGSDDSVHKELTTGTPLKPDDNMKMETEAAGGYYGNCS